jgi:cyclopropane fatty-acyl-phospholipid synthase-like methyltransferase
VDSLDLRGVRTTLDLGGGPGTYGIEFAKRGIEVTLFDLPDTMSIAREIVGEAGVKGVSFVSGDYHIDDIGTGYDLVLLSQILHSLSPEESIELLTKAGNALNPKGKVAIHEFALAENRAAPPSGALFSINMLINTPGGRSYTPREMTSWLKTAGFGPVRVKRLAHTVLVTGVKV